MPATPRDIPFDYDLSWFAARFTSGTCSSCDEPVEEGDVIAYNANGQLVAQACCGNAPDRDTTHERPERTAVMPTGKTKRDMCRRCFLIHTNGQGDNCE